jgi:hypothetical protein
VTRYAVRARPDLGSFEFATLAVLAALVAGEDAAWEAVDEETS